MKYALPVVLVAVTAALIVPRLYGTGQAGGTVGVTRDLLYTRPKRTRPIKVWRTSWQTSSGAMGSRLCRRLAVQRYHGTGFHPGLDGIEREFALILQSGRF